MTMPEYITKEQAINVVHEAIANIINSDSEMVCLTDLEIEIEMTITDYTEPADVVEVVRCEDCKHRRTISGEGWGIDTELYYCGENEILVSLAGYCSDGKSKDGRRK